MPFNLDSRPSLPRLQSRLAPILIGGIFEYVAIISKAPWSWWLQPIKFFGPMWAVRKILVEFIFWIILPGPYLASLLWKIVNHVDFRGIPPRRAFEQRGPSRSPSRPFVPGCDDRKLSRACLRRAQRIEQQILQLGEQLFSVPWLGKGQG